MKLSTRSRYGMRAMLDIAVNSGDSLVLLRDVAARQGVSKRYLEHIMTMLRNCGLVVAERGARGGYRLARNAEDITLMEVFEALEGDVAPVNCVTDPSLCDRATECIVRELWDEITSSIRSVLENKTLAGLRAAYEERAADKTGGGR